MFVRRAYIPDSLTPEPPERDGWPFTVPCVAALVEHGLTFTHPVTFLVGDNGSGKSTLVEAIAEGFRLDPYGGRAGARTGRPNPRKSPLGAVLRLETTAAGARMLGGPRLKKKGFFLRAETAFAMTENLGGVPGYWAEDTSRMSHGEGFTTIFRTMMNAPGFYVMDEPESALSFTSCLHLTALMYELGRSGAQVICATHSPILAATPGADIIEIGEHGFRRTPWEKLELVDHWRRYLDNPRSYLRHLVDGGGDDG
ncbi:ATP-binding cassette domain-containing protein [Protofrankia symbiont of Coriaria ruscifolia]|uniref:AAA family ATPase n=1 Tax=Protofrankia symbiont of Coriaria ruscifolia TaxID=1306542 RepID=UPI001041AD08|nr:AAA family ATPase [Protofrankia symbiont of Coriaria ruscifolia]